jgi:hypothetical protein
VCLRERPVAQSLSQQLAEHRAVHKLVSSGSSSSVVISKGWLSLLYTVLL